MRKLGGVEKFEDFILAIASGADVNGTWRGSPLVEYYFVEAMRAITLKPTSDDINMKKLKTILTAGADIEPLFQSSYETYEYGNLVRTLSKKLELLEIVLSNGQAKEIILHDESHQKDLVELYSVLQAIKHTISVMEKEEATR